MGLAVQVAAAAGTDCEQGTAYDGVCRDRCQADAIVSRGGLFDGYLQTGIADFRSRPFVVRSV